MPTYFPEKNVPKSTDPPNRSLQKINALLGVVSGTYIGNTSLNEGYYTAVQVLTDAKFHTLTGTTTGVANTSSGSAPTIPAGIVVYGEFTAIQLHSGSVIAYTQ